MKSYPRVSKISLSCTLPGVRFYISHKPVVRTNLDIYVFILDSVLEYSIEFPIYKMARMGLFFIFGVLTPLSAVFELYQWRPVLVVEEAGVPRENHRPWASNW